ncbi:MAG: diguanylate cyclase, partial [Ruminococcus sp.]|nr:diguanylate cyclase [Ruminococcus sp.]
LKPKKFDYTAVIITVLYCIFIVYINLDYSKDELGNIILDDTTLVEIVNTIFNVLILTIALAFFIHIKYNSKVSDIYKTHKLQELSSLDVLTGLFNRMSLTQYIENMNSSKYDSIVIAMMDIDNFKKINDTYGHPIGDKCIHLVGEKINEISSKGYRYGGEEFLIIFENLEVSKVCDIMEKFRKDIENSETATVKFTISIGISNKYNSTDIENIIEQADERLYKAKKTGKNKIVFE